MRPRRNPAKLHSSSIPKDKVGLGKSLSSKLNWHDVSSNDIISPPVDYGTCMVVIKYYLHGFVSIPQSSKSVLPARSTAGAMYNQLCRGHTRIMAVRAQAPFCKIEILINHIYKLLFDIPYLFKVSSKPLKSLSIPETIDIKQFWF